MLCLSLFLGLSNETLISALMLRQFSTARTIRELITVGSCHYICCRSMLYVPDPQQKTTLSKRSMALRLLLCFIFLSWCLQARLSTSIYITSRTASLLHLGFTHDFRLSLRLSTRIAWSCWDFIVDLKMSGCKYKHRWCEVRILQRSLKFPSRMVYTRGQSLNFYGRRTSHVCGGVPESFCYTYHNNN